MATHQKTVYLPLEGVDSEHCAMIVEEGLSKVQGLDSYKVELNNNRAVIQPQDQQAVADAVQTIKDLGYGVDTIRQTFPVLNMTCASCAVSVQSMLKAQTGVINAEVNYATGNVKVEYIPGAISLAEMRKAVQGIGYDLLIDEGNNEQQSIEIIHRQKFERLKTKTWWAIGLSIPVLIIGMFFMNMPFANIIMWALSTPVVIWLGRGFFINAWKQARHRSANMDTLVALSTGVAYLFSVFNMLFPGFWHSRGLHADVYFEAASVIIAFILLGKLLEEKAKGNTSSAIKKLMGLQPTTVTIVHEGGHQMQMRVEQVQPGNILQVKPGEKIAVDGTVISGSSYVDESMLSGEPVAVQKKAGDKVFAGTINQKGSFRFRAEKVGSDTMLSHIIQMVQEAQGSKAPVQKLVDKIAGIFVPVVICIAIIAYIAWNIFAGANGFTHGLLALITVLVIACPCAMGLATPTAIMVGIGKGADEGILIKDAESLEQAKKINAVIFDKTGTITEGKPEVTNEWWANENPQNKQILLTIENASEHPLAHAVAEKLKDFQLLSAEDFESITGKGVRAVLNGSTWLAGNRQLMDEFHIPVNSKEQELSRQWSNEAKTVIYFAGNSSLTGMLAIADEVKPTSKAAVSALQDAGIEVYMLTGDNENTAKAIAEKTGIRHFKAGVLPSQKAEYVKELQSKGKIVAMVGDGINDSTALAQADVSIAMGKGSDIAMDVAKMTVISSDLSKIPEAIRLSKSTVRTIRQNLFWAFIYNIIGIPLAAGILYPFTGFLINPMIAGAAMAFSSVSVVSNSLRLKWKK
jgi:Cu2+-exporting ATPase